MYNVAGLKEEDGFGLKKHFLFLALKDGTHEDGMTEAFKKHIKELIQKDIKYKEASEWVPQLIPPE
jgi:hypothetical protein